MNWIICPFRNGLEFTKAALPTFLSQSVENIHVLLMDNGSTDGSVEWARALSDKDDRINIWNSAGSRSVSKTWNTGLALVFFDTEVDSVLVVNNDVLLRPDTYAELLKDGGPFVTAIGNADSKCVQPLPSKYKGGSPRYTMPDPSRKRPHPDFSCFLIRRECFDNVGKFDEQFEGAFFEDNDYHIRMHRAGIRAVCIDLPCYHYGSATIKSAMGTAEAERIAYSAEANKKRFFKKWGCYPATPEYDAMFSEETFGIDAKASVVAG